MKLSKTPRFLLQGAAGWKTLESGEECVLLAAFSSHAAAAVYCQTETEPQWECFPLDSALARGRLTPPGTDTQTLLALDPRSPDDYALLAAEPAAAHTALQQHADLVPAECQLVRDCVKRQWRCEPLVETADAAVASAWYVSCRCPRDLILPCGAPMWFWLAWFGGRHMATEHQTEVANAERFEFAFPSAAAAEGFARATVARLDGSVHHCYVERHYGSEFEVAVCAEGQAPVVCSSGTIGQKLHIVPLGQ